MATVPTGNLPHERRIRRMVEDAPDDAVFEGYGGSHRSYETLVFFLSSMEIRIPVWPNRFTPAEVEHEYGCVSGRDWHEVLDNIEAGYEEMIEEHTNR